MSMVAVSMIWLWLYQPSHGIFNRVLNALGFPSQLWLFNPATSLGSIIAMSIWKAIGYNMVIYLSGLHAIPAYLYEAAMLDGAGAWNKLRHITLPMLSPITFFLFVTGMINSFKVFEQVNILTAGGPLNSTTTIAHQIYTRGVTEVRMGYAASLAIVLLLIVAVITLVNFKYGSQGKDIDV
jgi:ABC-type sugar transport system permease subunit